MPVIASMPEDRPADRVDSPAADFGGTTKASIIYKINGIMLIL